jgi:hypothetical protein
MCPRTSSWQHDKPLLAKLSLGKEHTQQKELLQLVFSRVAIWSFFFKIFFKGMAIDLPCDYTLIAR